MSDALIPVAAKAIVPLCAMQRPWPGKILLSAQIMAGN